MLTLALVLQPLKPSVFSERPAELLSSGLCCCRYLLWTNMGPGRRAAATGSWRPRLRRWSLWCGLADYFPARLHKTVDLDPSKKYLFGFCPHGIIGTAVWCGFATEACGFSQLFPGIDLRVGESGADSVWYASIPLCSCQPRGCTAAQL